MHLEPIKFELHTWKKRPTSKTESIVLPDTKIGNLLTDKGMSVGLLVSVIGHMVGIWQWNGPDSGREPNTEREKGHWNEIKGTKMHKQYCCKAIVENQNIR